MWLRHTQKNGLFKVVSQVLTPLKAALETSIFLMITYYKDVEKIKIFPLTNKYQCCHEIYIYLKMLKMVFMKFSQYKYKL